MAVRTSVFLKNFVYTSVYLNNPSLRSLNYTLVLVIYLLLEAVDKCWQTL